MRGSRRSRVHITEDPNNKDDDYWEFDLTDMADYDVPAMIEGIRYSRKKEGADCNKVTIVAHSLGTMNTVTSLARSTHAQDYIQAVVLMEPCILPDATRYFPLGGIGYHTLSYLTWKFNIDTIFGPHWRKQRSLLCSALGWWSSACRELFGRALFGEDEESWGGKQEMPVKIGKHLLQNHLRGEFQEYANYFNWGFRDAPDHKLEQISPEVPIRVLFASEDNLCPPNT